MKPSELYHHLTNDFLVNYQLNLEIEESTEFLKLDKIFIKTEELKKSYASLVSLDKKEILIKYAPTALVSGCCFRQMLLVPNTYTELGMAFLEAYHLEIGNGDFGKHRANQYRSLLGSYGILIPEIGTRDFVLDTRFSEADFSLPLFELYLSKYGQNFIPEIIGLYFVKVTLSFPQFSKELLLKTFCANEYSEKIVASLARILEASKKLPNSDLARISSAIIYAINAEIQWIQSLHSRSQSILKAPWTEMVNLMREKIPYSFGHHKNVLWQSQSLDNWMNPSTFDPEFFLSNLKDSHWVCKGDSSSSPLVSSLIEFGGPMFGVFTETEIQIIRNWIDCLDKENEMPILVEERRTLPQIEKPVINRSPIRYTRELYHRLLNRFLYPDVEFDARHHIESLLQKTRKIAISKNLKKNELFLYTESYLKEWVDEKVYEQVNGKEFFLSNFIVKNLSKQNVLWILTQFAPASFVDGGWLQDLYCPKLFHRKTSTHLFEIYRDEMGSGKLNQHHGQIMKSLLESYEINFSSFETREFTNDKRFLDESFSMPVLWLSMSILSLDYLPELLGLNLATEMAGLGQEYNFSIAMLREHSIDPYFFCLHRTVDNASIGHTAQSVYAIQKYMDKIKENYNSRELDLIWTRIWAGFYLYELVSKPFGIALVKKLSIPLISNWWFSAYSSKRDSKNIIDKIF